MVEMVEAMDGSIAYSVAMGNLQPTWSNPRILMEEYPNSFFYYGSGRGLVLPHGLVYISTESSEAIKAVGGGVVIERPSDLGGVECHGIPDLSGVDFHRIEMRIPDEAITDVIAFTEEVKAKILTRRQAVPQK